MLTNSDRTLLYGAMAFIAYQLYMSRKCACGQTGGVAGCAPPSATNPNGAAMVAPGWVQQLSQVGGQNFFDPQCGIWGRCS